MHRLLYRLGVLLTVLILLPECQNVNPIVEKFHALVQAIDKSISYATTHYGEINFDGAFGLWIAKGYLKYLLSTSSLWKDNFGNPVLVQTKKNLTRLLQQVENVVPDVVKSLRKRDADYFNKMGAIFRLNWFPQPPNSFFEMGYYAEESYQDVTFDEQLSDRCISQLLLTNRSAYRCQPSGDCLELITGNPSHGYELTHQVLYTTILLELDCSSALMEQLEAKGLSLFSLSINLCSYTFRELWSLIGLKKLSAKHRDLLMEQVFVCSHLGFLRFNQLPILDLILSWQHPSGCFTDKSFTETSNIRNKGRLHLMEEHRLSDGCLSHLTSVATAALMTFLRRFLSSGMEGIGNERDLYSIILARELLDQNSYFPQLLEPPKYVDRSSLDLLSWEPSVPEARLMQLAQFHRIDSPNLFKSVFTQPGFDTIIPIDMDRTTKLLLHGISLFSLISCMLLCLRFRRRLNPCTSDCV